MAYLRLVRSSLPESAPRDPCVDVFDREVDYLFETLRRLGATPSEVEDLAHDVFVVLHRNWATLDTERPLRPYLFGIAFRVVSAHRRRRHRLVLQSAPEAEETGPGPERELQSEEARALLLAALERVPLTRRAVIILHELDGVPVADVARTLSITRFGVYARLHKGRKELRAAVRRMLRQGARS